MCSVVKTDTWKGCSWTSVYKGSRSAAVQVSRQQEGRIVQRTERSRVTTKKLSKDAACSTYLVQKSGLCVVLVVVIIQIGRAEATNLFRETLT